jgi:hypothetical protein
MSPRTLLRGLVPFGRAISGRRFSRNNARRPRRQWLAAELLESRCMLSATARLENNTSMFDRIPVIHGSQPANPGGSFVGQFFWNGSGFKSFCVEGQQSISPGLHTFPTVTSLSISGLANADLVEQFWRSYGPTTPTGFTSVTDAAAFQLGIWEIISDGPSRDLKSGSFRVGDSASPAVARAESWLNGTGTPAAGAGGSVPLHVMQHPTMQDQVIWGPLPPPSVSVKVTPTSVTEDGPQKLTYEFTASPAPTAAITVNYRIGGSAKAGSDFTGLPPGATTGTITIRAGSTSPVTLTIVPTADTEIEPNETVILTLQQGAGYALGTSVATGTITNDDLPAVTLAVSPASVTEDGTTNLVYTFTRTGPTTSALTVKYGITGTADAADYTGATPGTGKTISFDAGSATATVTIDPTVDTTPEFDETVILTLAPGSGYTVGTTTPVTGTIENDDYLLDLVLDGLPEETAPEPNELSPGAILPIGGGRTRLDLIVESPGYAGTLTLFVTTGADGADAVTLWDSEEDGKQVLPTTWPVGQHPRTLWVKTTGVEADVQFIAMFQHRGRTKEDAVKATASALPKVTLAAKRVIDVAANDTFNEVAAANPWLANGAKAYVPVNNDDDDNDGKIDSTQAVVNLVDDDLLPIALRKNAADPAPDGWFTVEFNAAQTRLWQLNAARNAYEPVDATTEFRFGAANEIDLFMEAIASGGSALRLKHHASATKPVAKVDSLDIERFTVTGPRNVPGFCKYEYTDDLGTGKWTNSAHGTDVDLAHNKAEVLWNEGPVFGKVRYEASTDYTWAFNVAVVQVVLDLRPRQGAQGSGLEYADQKTNGVTQDPFLQERKFLYLRSTVGRVNHPNLPASEQLPADQQQLDEPAMKAIVRVTSVKGPERMVDGQPKMFGVSHIEVGFIQTLEFTKYNATVQWGGGVRETLEYFGQVTGRPLQGETLLDMITKEPAPQSTYRNPILQSIKPDASRYQQPYYYAGDINGGVGRFSPDTDKEFKDLVIGILDQPQSNFGRFVEGPNHIVAVALEWDFDVSLVVRTKDADNEASTIFTKRAFAEWSFNASGSVNRQGAWTGAAGSGVSGDATFKEIKNGERPAVKPKSDLSKAQIVNDNLP